MKYLNRMVVQLMEENGFIQEESRQETLASFDEKTSAAKGKVTEWLNNLLSHPLAALAVIALYGVIRSWLNKISLTNQNMTVEERFKTQMKEQVFKEILENNK